MPMTPRERKRRFKAQAALAELTLAEAAERKVGVGYFHLHEVVRNRRAGSDELKQRFADYIGCSFEDVWGEKVQATTAVHVA